MLMLGELVLSRVPAFFYMSGYMALWLSAFAAWSTLFFVRTGRWVGWVEAGEAWVGRKKLGCAVEGS